MVAGGSLVRLLWFLLCALTVAQSLGAAQTPAAIPQDAKQLLQVHQDWEALPSLRRAEEAMSLNRAYVYLRAGAEGEVRQQIVNLTEEHPDALRFAMQADCWNPTNFVAGRARADAWLLQFPNRSDVEVQSVQSVQSYLGNAESRRQFVHDRAASSRWYPVGSILFVLLLAAGVIRILP